MFLKSRGVSLGSRFVAASLDMLFGVMSVRKEFSDSSVSHRCEASTRLRRCSGQSTARLDVGVA